MDSENTCINLKKIRTLPEWLTELSQNYNLYGRKFES